MRRREFIASLVVGTALARHADAQSTDRKRRVGVLMSTAETDPLEKSSVAAFVVALDQLGWTEGRNLELAYRWGAGDPQRMDRNTQELVGLSPDALLVKGANVPAARKATKTIPIVFVVTTDSVVEGYVGSFAHPCCNLTGFTSYEQALVGKRLELLREISPAITRVLYLRSRVTGASTIALFQTLVEKSRGLGITISDAPAETETEIERAVDSFAGQPNSGLIAAYDAFITVYREKIIELAARLRLPAIYPLNFAQSGGLISYGFSQDEQFRQAAGYVARLLGGAKPSELPVQAPTKFELMINLKTAKALGLEIAPSLLARADEVIE